MSEHNMATKTEEDEEYDRLYDAMMDDYNKQIQELAKELRCSQECAEAVFYFRTRSRYDSFLEKELVDIYNDGGRVNINEWPPG